LRAFSPNLKCEAFCADEGWIRL